MADRVKMAVVGLGQRGLQHLQALWTLQGRGDVQVVALCDASSENLSAEKIGRFVPGYDDSDLHASTDFVDVIAQKPDAVVLRDSARTPRRAGARGCTGRYPHLCGKNP